jgi:mRNA-degrading endonuclease toxin of MazEF toxin-antitoxin module
MGYQQGSVVLAPALYKTGLRPFFIISNNERPFYPESYTAAVMSTTKREEAVEIVPGVHIADGRLNEQSFINIWALCILRDEDIVRRVAQVSDDKTQQACSTAQKYIRYG